MRFSSPRYAQSNGLAEKGVAIAKNILKRCYEAQETKHFQYRLLEYNTTPVASIGLAPVQLIFGRMVKTRMPISSSLLHRNHIDEKFVQTKFKEKRQKQKYYYDRSAKSLPVLELGDRVIFKKNSKEWYYGTIVDHVNNRSYIIKDSFDNYFRRNRRFIAKTKNNNFNVSDMMYEENIKQNVTNPDIFKEIQIVPEDRNNKRNSQSLNKTKQIECNVDDSQLPVSFNNTSTSSDNEYETADSSESESNEKCGFETPEIAVNKDNIPVMGNEQYRTSSGRTVRPPQRYGWD